eukprot:6771353-Prymnesium_polylepis.1
MALSGMSAAAAASATQAADPVVAALDPLSVWESYFATTTARVPEPTEGMPPANDTWSSAAAFIAESPTAPLLRVLAA